MRMKEILFTIIFLLTAVSCINQISFSQSGPGLPYTIWGKVKDESGEGLNGVEVKILKDGNVLASNTTYHDNSTGDGTFMITFNLGDLKSGDKVDLVISKEGYETKTIQVEIDTFLPSKKVDDIILLAIKKDEKEKKTPFLSVVTILLVLIAISFIAKRIKVR